MEIFRACLVPGVHKRPVDEVGLPILPVMRKQRLRLVKQMKPDEQPSCRKPNFVCRNKAFPTTPCCLPGTSYTTWMKREKKINMEEKIYKLSNFTKTSLDHLFHLSWFLV